MKVRVRRPTVRDSTPVPLKIFPKQILNREEQKNIEDPVVRQICKGLIEKLVLTVIY